MSLIEQISQITCVILRVSRSLSGWSAEYAYLFPCLIILRFPDFALPLRVALMAIEQACEAEHERVRRTRQRQVSGRNPKQQFAAGSNKRSEGRGCSVRHEQTSLEIGKLILHSTKTIPQNCAKRNSARSSRFLLCRTGRRERSILAGLVWAG